MSPDARERYGAGFQAEHHEGSLRSARRIVPLVQSHVAAASAVDVGCGSGAWLAALAEHGVVDVIGVDGADVDSALLRIAPERFLHHDLRTPLRLPRRFDLVLCLEVAEHLPESCATDLVGSLVALGPCVLFSAAVPGQGGTGHVNEQWPSWWIARFAAHDYRVVDAVRPHVWAADDVEPWYAQNALLFVAADELARRPALAALAAGTPSAPLDLVHPRLYSPLVARVASETARALEHYELASRFETDVARLERIVGDYVVEVDALKAERDAHRAKAEAFAAEVEQLKGELAHHRGRAEAFYAEVEALKDTARSRQESEPGPG